MSHSPETIRFQTAVWAYYRQHGRQLPWRLPDANGAFDPYKILVSELMLQQTQVARVIPKYQQFVERFSTVHSLANADLAAVLQAWSGLGYNRRAKFLWQAAQMIVEEFDGQFPASQAELERLPGVGSNTAGAVLDYAFDQPVVFVETNIRSVFLHHFFADQDEVSDKEILALVKETLPAKDARTWYWALMDYGAHLKATQPRHLHRAKAHTKQSAFEGSARQLRGKILRLLGERPRNQQELQAELADARSRRVVQQLASEQLIHITGGKISLG